MFRKLILIACGIALVLPAALLAQAPPPPAPPMPGLMIPLPEGVMPPPPESGPEAFDAFLADVFAAIDANGDGVVSLEELKAWMAKFKPPMPPEGGDSGPPPGEGDTGTPPPEGEPGPPPAGADFSMLPDPPVCDDGLFTSEMLPQATGHPCASSAGNLIFRTVCNSSGYNTQAISMPAGRTAGCFGIEAITKNVVIFSIYPEADPTNVLFDSDRDGLENLGAVMGTLTHAADTVYRIDLDMTRSDPNARITVRFVDY